jgi:HSP20 family protein
MADNTGQEAPERVERHTRMLPWELPELLAARWPDLEHRLGEVFGDPDHHRIRIEELVEDGEAVIRAELPGLDPEEDIDVTVRDRMVHLRAQRSSRRETTDEGVYRSEFAYGAYERTIPLPAGASEDDVSATYTDGILELRLPLGTGEQEGRRIAIDRG